MDYIKEPEKQDDGRRLLDRIKGSLVGGAAGDALGYAVEFYQDRQIFAKYGRQGISSYALSNGLAKISDDTQMTLFTANAILFGATRLHIRGIGGDPAMYAPQSYSDWFLTQILPFEKGAETERNNGKCGISWLLDVPELYSRRAPGNTCLSAMQSIMSGGGRDDYIKNPINHSKGCGGIMRIAPLGLYYSNVDLRHLDMTGAKLSAITHGHSLGYMPSAVLTHILNRIVYPEKEHISLKEIIVEARDTAAEIFREDVHIGTLTGLINHAVELSENSLDDLENIKELGAGWVAEETLAIAIYCSLKYRDDFSRGIVAAVNHSGDSDSTGAVTGNILGALLGYGSIDKKWKTNLELHDVICEMAEDLYYGRYIERSMDVPNGNWLRRFGEAWRKKYVEIHWEKSLRQ